MTPDERLRAWGAEPTGERWTTPSSDLAAGVLAGEPVILKIARIEEERRGNRLMTWWSGTGGLPVLAADDDAILMRRATGARSLTDLSAAGLDDAAEDVLLDTVVSLHGLPAPPGSVGLVPLRTWFRDLVDRVHTDPLLQRAARGAVELLAEDGPSVVLHGDVHHGNVLDLGDRWVAIDPKGLVGHPAFDVANLCCNPSERTAADRLDRRLDRSAERLGLDRDAVEAWVVAWCGLTLAWSGSSDASHPRTARLVLSTLLGRR